MTITVLSNNVAQDANLETAWGMSCLIEGTEKTILFDTGGDGRILLSNMKKLGKDPGQVDLVVLSHNHGDHVDGLWDFLEACGSVEVYLLESFPDAFKERAGKMGAKVTSVDGPAMISERVHLTGPMGAGVKEQALILKSPKGLVVITGCAHPGVVNMVRKAKEVCPSEVHLVFGGFHLGAYSEQEVGKIINGLRTLGVKKVGPSHCTGGRPIEMFRQAWGEDFIDMGCGASIRIDE